MARKTLQERINQAPLLMKLIICLVCLIGMIVGFFSISKTIEESLNDLCSSVLVHQENDYIELETVTIKRVVDGDTIIVLDQQQNEVRVRMIGVDTPESVHPDETKNTTDGDIASAYTKSQLKKGQSVYLEFDNERLDQYGRTLAYVWLDSNVDSTDVNEIQTKMYNAKLIVEGYGVAKRFPPNIKYATVFESIK